MLRCVKPEGTGKEVGSSNWEWRLAGETSDTSRPERGSGTSQYIHTALETQQKKSQFS